jgi:AraC-like DNA-binding protein/mannose-6-phosphate isomerase-like protein (cupin superfamily)
MEFGLFINKKKYTINHITTNMMSGRLYEKVSVHKHPVFHLIYILEGKGTFHVGALTTTAEPGMLYVINPNEPHGFLFGDGEPLTNLESTFQLFDEDGEAAADVNFFDMIEAHRNCRIAEPIRSRPFVVPIRFQPLLREGFGRILDLYASPLLRNHFSLMVADLMVRVEKIVESGMGREADIASAEERIESIKHYLHSNRNRAVTLQEVADYVHLTPNYLCRIFKKSTGETLMGYLQAVRMREAEKLLSLTDLPVYTIAEKLGYEDASYFSRLFRCLYGESPRMYRKRLLAQIR